MTFTAYVKPLHEIIDQIADELIALPEWEEGDATWDTSDTTGVNARRVVHHIADDVYLSLVMENRNQYNKDYDEDSWRGLTLIFSSSWDPVAHEPDGSMYYTFAGFQCDDYTWVAADLAKLDVDYRLYTGAEGFALVGVPPPNLDDNRQSSFIVVVERNATKLYADGFTNFYIFVDGNYFINTFNTYSTNQDLFGIKYKWWRYSHPFNIQAQTGYESPYEATHSRADDKAYFAKPILHNDADNKSPILQGEIFLMTAYSTSKMGGLVDDDEIVMNGKKYQVVVKQSPDSKEYMTYGIKKAG